MNPFKSFEIVKIVPNGELDLSCNADEEMIDKRQVIGREGVIRGYVPISYEDQFDDYIYAQYLGVEIEGIDPEGRDDVLNLNIKDLQHTGRFKKQEDYYDGSSLKVTQDGEVKEIDVKDEEK